MDVMDPLETFYNHAKTFPRNFIDRTLPPCALDDISSRLDKHAPRLFLDEGKDSRNISLNFLELENNAEGTAVGSTLEADTADIL